jgi:hypothetical protein
VRLAYWQALDDATNARDGKERLGALVDELDGAGYTAAAKCLGDDLEALVVHLRYPTRHRRRWRSTNLLERSLGEVKRRTKVIGRFPGETSCLTLVWAVLDLYITHATNGVRFTQLERQRLNRIRYEGREQTITEEVTAAQTDQPPGTWAAANLQQLRNATGRSGDARFMSMLTGQEAATRF